MPRVAPEVIPLVKCEDFELNEVEEQIKFETNRALNRIGVLLQQYAAALNNIKLGDNLGEAITADFGTGASAIAGSEITATHTLNKIPVGIIGVKLDKPGALYFSQTPTITEIYLKSDTDSLSATLYIA